MTSGSQVIYQRNKRVNDNLGFRKMSSARPEGPEGRRGQKARCQMYHHVCLCMHIRLFSSRLICSHCAPPFPNERTIEKDRPNERRRANRTNLINRKIPVSFRLSFHDPPVSLRGALGLELGLGATIKTSIRRQSDSALRSCTQLTPARKLGMGPTD